VIACNNNVEDARVRRFVTTHSVNAWGSGVQDKVLDFGNADGTISIPVIAAGATVVRTQRHTHAKQPTVCNLHVEQESNFLLRRARNMSRKPCHHHNVNGR